MRQCYSLWLSIQFNINPIYLTFHPIESTLSRTRVYLHRCHLNSTPYVLAPKRTAAEDVFFIPYIGMHLMCMQALFNKKHQNWFNVLNSSSAPTYHSSTPTQHTACKYIYVHFKAPVGSILIIYYHSLNWLINATSRNKQSRALSVRHWLT